VYLELGQYISDIAATAAAAAAAAAADDDDDDDDGGGGGGGGGAGGGELYWPCIASEPSLWMVKRSVEVSLTPSDLDQLTVGWGLPVARQGRVMFLRMSTAWLWGASTTTGDAM